MGALDFGVSRGASVTPLDFARALLSRLGLPLSSNNLISIVAFVGIEGGHYANAARFNPLNTTLVLPGSTRAPGTIVQAYTSWTQGVEANARTLAQSNMRGITQALAQSVDPQMFLRALSDSPWCSAKSTVADRAPECTGEPGQGPCYCNYAKFSARALYQNWANRKDPVGGGALVATTGAQVGGVAILLAVAVLLAVVWYKWGRR